MNYKKLCKQLIDRHKGLTYEADYWKEKYEDEKHRRELLWTQYQNQVRELEEELWEKS